MLKLVYAKQQAHDQQRSQSTAQANETVRDTTCTQTGPYAPLHEENRYCMYTGWTLCTVT